MGDKYLNGTGLATLWNKIKSVFAKKDESIKSITRSGTTFTATRADNTTFTFTQQDTNTTYSAATTSAAGLMSAADKTKLNGIASGAEVNVQSDWNQTDTTADDYIKNAPSILAAVSGGTAQSLVSTGEKYNWNNKGSSNLKVELLQPGTLNPSAESTANSDATKQLGNVVLSPGINILFLTCRWGGNASGSRYMYLANSSGGLGVMYSSRIAPAGSSYCFQNLSCVINVSQSTTITVYGLQNSGGARSHLLRGQVVRLYT